MNETERVSILVLGTADWDQPIATNQHYMSKELADSWDVTFVESMGLRRPGLSVSDGRRVVRRVTGGFGQSALNHRNRPARLDVISPRVIPAHRGLFRWLNSYQIDRELREWISYRGGRRILWTYTPLTYDLERHADVTVYHCVDLLAEVPRIDGRLIANHEARLAETADYAIGSSPVVVDHLAAIGYANILSWPNVAETGVFSTDGDVERQASRVLFAGNMTHTKVDFSLLAEIASSGYELHLAGPMTQGRSGAKIAVGRLQKLGACYHGMLDLASLAELSATCAVGLVPYALNAYTRGVNPLKTYEYLASGLAVVSTRIPAVAPIPNMVWVSDDTQTFLDNLEQASHVDAELIRDRRIVAHEHSWNQRGETARALIADAYRRSHDTGDR